jgi:hypothetical protein
MQIWIVEISTDGGQTWRPKSPWALSVTRETSEGNATRLNQRYAQLPADHKFASHRFRATHYAPLEGQRG